jgi:dTDP-4-amino-4,6-dideoxygalactose transaminase
MNKLQSNIEMPYLPFSAPSFGDEEKAELLAALESDWITTGPRTIEFEKRFAKYVGTTDAVAVNSCTAALHLALAALNIGPGDAVITSPFTFAATANVIVYQHAFPIFVDIEPNCYNIDPSQLRSYVTKECVWNRSEKCLRVRSNNCRVRAIIPVHYGGNPCDMDVVSEIADRFQLAVVEDAAHAAGACYHGHNIGTLGTASCFSFYANKNMTTAEGGMLTTNDTELASRVRVLRLHGINKDGWARYGKNGRWRYDLAELGFKYNMTDLAAAIGLHQLNKLNNFIARRACLAKLYHEALAGVLGIKVPTDTSYQDTRNAWHLYPVQITHPTVTRDEVIEQLHAANIGCSVHFIPLHLMSFYQRAFGYKHGDFPVAEQVFDRVMSLPLFPRMQDADVERVVESLRSVLSRSRGFAVNAGARASL